MNLRPDPLPTAGILETETKTVKLFSTVKRLGDNALQDVRVKENDFSSRIPEEILLQIFRVALPPSWNAYFARTLPPFPPTIWSSDFETKLTIIQVCKRWYRIGLEFLYESVSLNSIGQLAVFVVALESRPHLGSLVRCLEICYWVPRGYRTLHDTELMKALALCPRLTYFAFNPQLVSPSETPFEISLPKFPPITNLDLREITHLDICDWVPYQSTLPALLYLSSTLQSLSVALPIDYGADHPTLVFPRVHSLRLCMSEESVHSGPYWSFPNLQQLHLFHTPRLGNRWRFSSAAKVFLANHGRSLRTLSLGKADDNERLKKLLRHCPNLQHLTIAEHWLPSKHDCCHETLQTLHIQRESKRRHCGFNKWKTMFPSLRSGHYVDTSYDLFPSLPAIDGIAEQLDYNLPSGSYLEFLHIVRYDPEYQPVVTQSDLDDSDTSDSETDSDSDSSHSDSSSTEGGDDWEIESVSDIRVYG
ncbi:F-box domain-containing protein [Favolaschia claudopus]|uniref:F-box domain-containing protein n=1 Tax=Favolaschia claudopus TaxID=2862362 RepID=A0AAW0D1T2_9AGAR